MRSVQLLQTGTRLVHVQSGTRLVHQTTLSCTRFQMRWMAQGGAYTLLHQASLIRQNNYGWLRGGTYTLQYFHRRALISQQS